MKCIIFAAALILCSCSSIGYLSPDDKVNLDKESVYIIGLKPNNFHVRLTYTEEKDGGVVTPLLSGGTSLWSKAKNGYVLSKEKAGRRLTLTRINKNLDPTGSDAEGTWGPCRGAAGLSFEVPAGKVIYISDIEYIENEGKLRAIYTQDLEAAKEYMNEYYPHLSDHVRQADIEFLPVYMPCSSIGIIVI